MPKVICTLPNAAYLISGVVFSQTPDRQAVISEDVDQDQADYFLSIPGYLSEEDYEPAEIEPSAADKKKAEAAAAKKAKAEAEAAAAEAAKIKAEADAAAAAAKAKDKADAKAAAGKSAEPAKTTEKPANTPPADEVF